MLWRQYKLFSDRSFKIHYPQDENLQLRSRSSSKTNSITEMSSEPSLELTAIEHALQDNDPKSNVWSRLWLKAILEIMRHHVTTYDAAADPKKAGLRWETHKLYKYNPSLWSKSLAMFYSLRAGATWNWIWRRDSIETQTWAQSQSQFVNQTDVSPKQCDERPLLSEHLFDFDFAQTKRDLLTKEMKTVLSLRCR